jgi:hypothetical protein
VVVGAGAVVFVTPPTVTPVVVVGGALVGTVPADPTNPRSLPPLQPTRATARARRVSRLRARDMETMLRALTTSDPVPNG